MDGLEKRVGDLLQFRLSLWLLLTILSVGILTGLFAAFSAFDEAHELQDDLLSQVASLFDQYHLSVPQEDHAGREADGDPESHLFVQLLSPSAPENFSGGTSPPLVLPLHLLDGMQSVRIGNDTYRVFVKMLANGQRLAVAQAAAFRDEIARDSALHALLPLLALLPILLIVVAYLVHQGFKPIAKLSTEIDQRSDQDLRPIGAGSLPGEIRPFVGAINRLFGRVEQSMDAQRRFVADAAHELRSPLTALSLQAERLADTPMSTEAHERLHTLREGIKRGRALIDQLLALARAHASVLMPNTSVSVQQVYRRVLEDLMPLAENKDIDIGVVSDLDASVLANEADLLALVKNLVDNAIRYSPRGGRIDLSLSNTDEGTTLMIEDNGPGIPEVERGRVFDPFYRVPGSDEVGSGLGLSIVKTIAARIGAIVSLGVARNDAQCGLRVRVTFPLITS